MTLRLSSLALILLLAACGAPSDDGAGEAAPAAPSAAPSGGAGQESLPFVKSQGGEEWQITWDAPEGWQSQEPSNSMRKAQYMVPPAAGDSDPGECVVFYFGAGQGGPPRMNAERWAGQFKDESGNPPEAVITESSESGRAVMRVTVEGTYAPSPMMAGPPQPPKAGYRLLGAIVEGPESNWFFKCTGPAATMEANEEAFDAMIASVR